MTIRGKFQSQSRLKLKISINKNWITLKIIKKNSLSVLFKTFWRSHHSQVILQRFCVSQNKMWPKPAATQQSVGSRFAIFSLNYPFKVPSKKRRHWLDSWADFVFLESVKGAERELLTGFTGNTLHHLRCSQHTSHTTSNPIYQFIHQVGTKEDWFFFFFWHPAACNSSSSDSMALFPPDLFVLQLRSESVMRPPALDIAFPKATASGPMPSPPQRRPPPRSALSIARVFIRNMRCRVGRSSSLRLWLHSNVMESPSPLSAGWFFSSRLCRSPSCPSVSHAAHGAAPANSVPELQLWQQSAANISER